MYAAGGIMMLKRRNENRSEGSIFNRIRRRALPMVLSVIMALPQGVAVLGTDSFAASSPGSDSTVNGHGLGYLQVPFSSEIPIVGAPGADSEYPLLKANPSSYNSYELKKLPEVRNQGSEGACWAFASLGAIEADLIHDGYNTGIDLSELQIAYFTCHKYNDPKGCHNKDNTYYNGYGSWLSNGGCQQMLYRAMMEGVGAVSEKEVPYREGYDLTGFSLDDEYAYGHNAIQLKGAYVMNITDTDAVKSAIKDHGGVAVSFYADEGYYNADTNAYYGNYANVNHGVMLVGWDDNFSRNNFGYYKPSNDGAWLVRNSWGYDGYDFYGYFWMSYEDKGLKAGQYAVAYDADSNTYDHTYAYFRNFYPETLVTVKPGSVVSVTFDASAGESITAVGFETASTAFTANATVKAGDEVATGSVNTHYQGFYVVELGNEIVLSEDMPVTVELTFSKTVYLALEDPHSTVYGSIALINGVDNGLRLDGSIYAYDPMIMLYTNDFTGETVAVESVSLDKTSLAMESGSIDKLTATVLPANATNKGIVWTSSDPDVCEVDRTGALTAGNAGTAVITASSKNGKTATCTVTVTGADVTGIKLDKTSLSLSLGNSDVINATVFPDNAGNKKVIFSSSEPEVASVDENGNVTANAIGNATITAKTEEGGFTAKCEVTVKKGMVNVTGLSVSYGSMQGMTVGERRLVNISVQPSNATLSDLVYSSSDPKVATIDQTGYVVARGLGNAILTIATPNGFMKVNINAGVLYEGDGSSEGDDEGSDGNDDTSDSDDDLNDTDDGNDNNRNDDASDGITEEPESGWANGKSGKQYWYENGKRQGTVDDEKGVMGTDPETGLATNRGREIYDPDSDGWYWLDACYNGAKAVGKEVWVPYIYQDEDSWDDEQKRKIAFESDPGMGVCVYNAITGKQGKWVRYDGKGRMLKGWVKIKGELAEIYPEQAGNTYYYDHRTGLMAKGWVTIDSRTYYFDEVSGKLAP